MSDWLFKWFRLIEMALLFKESTPLLEEKSQKRYKIGSDRLHTGLHVYKPVRLFRKCNCSVYLIMLLPTNLKMILRLMFFLLSDKIFVFIYFEWKSIWRSKSCLRENEEKHIWHTESSSLAWCTIMWRVSWSVLANVTWHRWHLYGRLALRE